MPAPGCFRLERRRAGLAPAGKAPPCHGARGKPTFAPRCTRDRVASGYRLIEPALAALPTAKKLVLATTHRRENIGDPIRYVLRALRTLGEDGDKLVALPVHLNPDVRKRRQDA